jgi:hypothetical protein
VVWTECQGNGKFVYQASVNEPQTDLKDAEVSAIMPIYQASHSSLHSSGADRDKPDIEECDGQSQAGQSLEVSEVGLFQVEAMAFHITEHLLNPHATAIGAQGLAFSG